MWPRGHDDKSWVGSFLPPCLSPPSLPSAPTLFLSLSHSCFISEVARALSARKLSALSKKAGRGTFYKKKKYDLSKKEPGVFLEKKKYFYVKTILKSQNGHQT